MKVSGGFFWMQDASAITCGGYDHVTDCIFMPRPRWWQVRRWWHIWRWFLRMPFSRNSGACAILVPPDPCGAGCEPSPCINLTDVLPPSVRGA